jgi:hypothetical protein
MLYQVLNYALSIDVHFLLCDVLHVKSEKLAKTLSNIHTDGKERFDHKVGTVAVASLCRLCDSSWPPIDSDICDKWCNRVLILFCCEKLMRTVVISINSSQKVWIHISEDLDLLK